MSASGPTPVATPWLRLILPFAAGYYLSYLLRNANAVIAPVLTDELQLGAADLGLLTSAYFIAFGAFQLPLGILLDRYGARRVEAVLLLFAAAGAFVFALGHTLPTLFLGRALIGLGVSACLMATLKSFSVWYPIERQSSLTGAIMMAGGLGAISATAPLEALLSTLGWRGVFRMLAVVLVAAAALLYLVVPERAAPGGRATLGQQWRELGHIFSSRPFWRFAPFMTLFAGGFMALQGLWAVPWFIEVEGLTREAAARHLMAMGIASLVGFFTIAAFVTRVIRRGLAPSTLLGITLALAWLSLAAILAGAQPALLYWIAMSFFFSVATIGYVALSSHFPPALFGRASTAANLLVFAGAFSLQWGIGLLIDAFGALGWTAARAFRAAFVVLAVLQLLAWSWYVLEGRRQAARGAADAVRPAP